MTSLGVHWLGTLHGCRRLERLQSILELRPWCLQQITAAGLTVVGEAFHQFNAAGVTGAVLLAESHFTVHTWPEHAMVTLDLFVCNHTTNNSACADVLWELLVSGFSPTQVDQQRLLR